MNKPYEDLPTQGENRGRPAEHRSGMNVRAPQAPDDDEAAAGQPTRYAYQLLHDEPRSVYRLRAYHAEAEGDEQPYQDYQDYRELGRYSSHEEVGVAIEELPEMYRFVVFENTQTGEIYFERARNLTGNWTDGGRFDQVTLFEDEDEAEAYVRSRQGPTGRS